VERSCTLHTLCEISKHHFWNHYMRRKKKCDSPIMWLWTALVVVSAHMHPQTISDTKKHILHIPKYETPDLNPLFTMIQNPDWYNASTAYDTGLLLQTNQYLTGFDTRHTKHTGWVHSSYNLPSSSIVFHVFMTQNLMPLFLLCNYEGWNFNSGNYLFTTDTK